MENIITEVRVFPKDDAGKTLGFASITLIDRFVVKNLRIVNGEKGIFIGMPSNKRKTGDFVDIFFPITQEARNLITNAILKKYAEVKNHGESCIIRRDSSVLLEHGYEKITRLLNRSF